MSLIALLAAGATTTAPIDPTPSPVAPTWELLTPLGADPLFYDPASVPAIDLSRPINLLADGNSISTAFYSEIGGTAEAIAKTPGISEYIHAAKSEAVSGAGWNNIKPYIADKLRRNWVDGRDNVLFVFETRNDVVLARRNNAVADINNIEQVAEYVKSNIRDYFAAIGQVRAEGKPWKVILASSIPTGGDPSNAGTLLESDVINAVDKWCESAWKELGAIAFVRFSHHLEFNHTGKEAKPFYQYLDIWQEQNPRFTHVKTPGKVLFGITGAEAIRRLAGLESLGKDRVHYEPSR